MDFSNGARFHVGHLETRPVGQKNKPTDKKEKKEEPTPQK
jgi:hypothetical protein